MLKKINWKALLIGFTWVISLAAVITLMSFIEIKKTENNFENLFAFNLGGLFHVKLV